MFSCILDALLGGWVLSWFGIDDYAVEFMRTALSMPQATVAYYYVFCVALGVITFILK